MADPKLLAAIVARPMDDAPRLVLADALTDAGDERGEFIVVQCLLAHRGVAPGARAKLVKRATALQNLRNNTWTKNVDGLSRFVMRRGFVDEVASSADALAERAKVLFASEPITRLLIDGATPQNLGTLANAGAFEHVLRLTVRGPILDAGARVLAIALAARKTPLVSLNLGRNGIGPDGAEALATALTGCRSLTLTGNAIGDGGLIALGSSKALASLDTLFVAENDITDDGLTTFAKSATMTALTRLGLARNDEVTSDGLRKVAKSKKLKRLKWLEFSDEDEGGQKIVTRH